MSEFGATEVVSGMIYTVTEVAGRPPAALADFAGEAVFSVIRNAHSCHVAGVGVEHESGVHFNEKTGATGRDVRVWQITHPEPDGPFQALPVGHI